MVNTLPADTFAPEYNSKFKPIWQTGNKWINDSSIEGIYARHHGTAMWSDFRKK